MARINKQYRLGEIRYVGEYLRNFHRGEKFFFPCRLASPEQLREWLLLPEDVRGMWTRGWQAADAVIIRPDEIWVVEAKLRPSRFREGIGSLLIYLPFVHTTPALQRFMPRTVVGVLLTPIEVPTIRQTCEKQGLKNLVWEPPWYDEYMGGYPPWERVPPRGLK